MKKSAAVNLRMTQELRDELQRLADEDGRELSNYIRWLLERHVRSKKDEQQQRKRMRD